MAGKMPKMPFKEFRVCFKKHTDEKSCKPDADTSQQHERQKTFGEFIIARGNAPKLFEFQEEAFN